MNCYCMTIDSTTDALVAALAYDYSDCFAFDAGKVRTLTYFRLPFIPVYSFPAEPPTNTKFFLGSIARLTSISWVFPYFAERPLPSTVQYL